MQPANQLEIDYTVVREESRARDWIRTSTTFRMLPPEDSASTNFATRAFCLKFEIRRLMFVPNFGLQI